MNALTIITIIIILSAAVIGYIKGLVRCVFGVLFSVITFLLPYLISPFIYGILVDRTTIDDYAERRVSAIIEENVEQKIKGEYFEKTGQELADITLLEKLKEEAYKYDPTKSDQTNIINNLSLPESLKKNILDNNNYGESIGIKADNFYDYISKYIVERAMRMVAQAVSFLLIGLILSVIIIALKLVSKLPILGGINRVFGALLGGFMGLLIVWIFFAICVSFPGQEFCANAVKQIEESKILTFIQDINLFSLIV